MDYQRKSKKVFDEFSSYDGSDKNDSKEYGIWEIELESEEKIRKTKKQKLCFKDAKCGSDDCFLRPVRNIAIYLCFVCDNYICDACISAHDPKHEIVKVENETNKKGIVAGILLERMSDKRMTDREFHEENVQVYERLNVKHELDKHDCWITGLCALQDKRWVGLDTFNNCMKIFSSVDSTFLRYIRFGSRPRDATELKVNQKPTVSKAGTSSNSGISQATRDETEKHCLIAVTFPSIKQIWFIDLNKTPAEKTKTVQMKTECRAIEFSDNKLFILSREEVDYESHDSVLILTADGDHLGVIKNKPNRFIQYIPDLIVNKKNIYLTDWDHHKILCINIETGKTISHLTIEGSRPRGITSDPIGNIYVCGWRHNKIYKLSPNLRGYEALNLDTIFTPEPYRMCFAHGKLLLGLDWSSHSRNFVTVVQVT